ncbi:MAG: threonine/serine exporter family protein [Oscillospiraceae bacterium]|nr:threonine/serine exporter family protein [Oscillospiraceae bacterium]
MDHYKLLDLATNLGYELAMAGAETFRVEESISRIMTAYGVSSEVFAIPNYLVVSITSEEGHPITRMRRIGSHGNNLDAVEKFSNLSRAICNRTPEPSEGLKWLDHVRSQISHYGIPTLYLGYFLGAAGYGLFFGGNLLDSVCAGICGILVGLTNRYLAKQKANSFFQTIASAFLMAILAYAMGAAGLTRNPDAVTIGALMILVPGLLFTNAMRDIIYGDTNSGINRIVQVFLIAAAIVLGTASAWNLASHLWGSPVSIAPITYSYGTQCFFAFLGCIGFMILFNVHGKGGFLCALGGALSWAVYLAAVEISGSEITGYFWSALFSSLYSEIMARIRKYPAISYLVISIFPMIPGAGVYYTMNYAVQGQMELFANKGMFTAAIAGIMAVGILLGSTVFRMYSERKMRRR